jgi:murein DD-endopeptidase
MRDMNRRTAFGWLSTSLAGMVIAQETGKAPEQAKAPTPTPRPIDTPLDVVVPVPPTAFQADGKTHLVYELHVTNLGRAECALTRIEVLPPNRAALVSYSADQLSRLITRPGQTPKEPLRIEGGLRAVAFVWITLDEAPTSLAHRVACKVGEYADEMVAECALIAVRKDPVVINPPLRGDGWLAANGPSNTSGHRRSMIPIGGSAHIAQRFAIDWLQVREDGTSFKGDRLDNKNYRCYGVDALAVADAVVVAVKDGIPENVPGANSRAVPITLETVGGNHVVLDLGGGRFAFYAHLQPGKIRVKMGDHVRKGQELGLVGNSGNSTEPHLHFHVCDRNSPLVCEGLPYALSSFEVQGKGELHAAGGSLQVTISPDGAGRRDMELPLQNEVVRFS